MTIDDLVQGTHGKVLSTHQTQFTSVTTDSRGDVKDKVFLALKGDVHNGHDYIKACVEKGVAAVISSEMNEEFKALSSKVTWIQVDDTLQALQSLGKYWREKLNLQVIGVTGSNGKTSVKDFAFTLLSTVYPVQKSMGSFNNHWGVPLTLLSLTPEHKMAVVEMGMNHSGEILRLCEIATPNIAMVNNVGRAHMGHFKSLDEIAAAKEEIYQNLGPKGVGIFNLENPFTKKMYEKWKPQLGKTYTFGEPKADVFLKVKTMTFEGLTISGHIAGVRDEAKVPVWGEHNIWNLMAAATICIAAGMDPRQIWANFGRCRSAWGRNQWIQLKSGADVVFDGYNANPESFRALLKNLEAPEVKSKKVVGIFGEMLEQGEYASQAHEELGEWIGKSHIQTCFFIGPSAGSLRKGFEKARKNEKNLITSDTYEQSLASKIKSVIEKNSLVVVKGSRGSALEKIVLQLEPINFSAK